MNIDCNIKGHNLTRALKSTPFQHPWGDYYSHINNIHQSVAADLMETQIRTQTPPRYSEYMLQCTTGLQKSSAPSVPTLRKIIFSPTICG